jgi:hypothetical protein
MNRRSFIGTISAVSVIGVAGCVDTDPDETDPSTSSPNEEPPENPPEERSLTVTDFTFEIVPAETISAEPEVVSHENGTVTIRGSIQVSDGCKSAELASDPEQGDSNPLTIRASVVEYTEEKGGVCTEAIETLGFELQVSYEGDTPEEFVVDIGGVEPHTHTLSVGSE